MKMTIVFSTTTFLALSATVFGQSYPPAQGPPSPSGTIHSLPTSVVITDSLINKVELKLFAENADIKAREETDKVRATLSLESAQTYGPTMAQTLYPDRPNSRYVSMPHLVTINVSGIQQKKAGVWIPYPWGRTVTVSTEVMVFCKGWETGNGEITIESKSQPPYLDADPSFSEEFVNFFLNHALTAKVDSRIRQALSEVKVDPTSSGLPSRCNTIGRDGGVAGNLADDKFMWSSSLLTFSTINSRLTVRPVKIKRLAARGNGNSVLYDASEAPTLEFWADAGFTATTLPSMVEGQEVYLSSMPPISIRRPSSSVSLVVVASLNHYNRGIEDNAFRLFSSAVNFGVGTQTIVVYKTYFRPAMLGTKPLKMSVPAYEITFQVEQPGVWAPPGGLILQ